MSNRKRSQTIKKLLESSSDSDEEQQKSTPPRTKKEYTTPKSVPKINLQGSVDLNLKGRVDVAESPIDLVQMMKTPTDKTNTEIITGLSKISSPVNSKSPRMYTDTELKMSLAELRSKYEKQLTEMRKEMFDLQNENRELREFKEQQETIMTPRSSGLMTPRSQSENELKSVKRKLREAEGKNKDLMEDLEMMTELVNEKLETKKTFEEMKRDAEFKREQAKLQREDKMQSKLLTKDFQKKELEMEEKMKKEESKWKKKCKELEEYYEQEKEELEIRLKRAKEKIEKFKEKLTQVLEERDTLTEKLEKFENKILKSEENEKHIKEELKEIETQKQDLIQKIEKFEEKQESLWKENEYLKKTNDLKDGYDQINMPRPPNAPPLNIPKKSIYPTKGGNLMGDLLAEIKKGIALRKGQIVDKGDFEMPIEVDIAEMCAAGLAGLKKTAWRKSMQRGEPLIIEKIAK